MSRALALVMLPAAAAFNVPTARLATPAPRVRKEPSMSAAFLALDAIEPAVSAYVGIWTPLFDAAKASGLAPEFLLHWGHGAAMGAVCSHSKPIAQTARRGCWQCCAYHQCHN